MSLILQSIADRAVFSVTSLCFNDASSCYPCCFIGDHYEIVLCVKPIPNDKICLNGESDKRPATTGTIQSNQKKIPKTFSNSTDPSATSINNSIVETNDSNKSINHHESKVTNQNQKLTRKLDALGDSPKTSHYYKQTPYPVGSTTNPDLQAENKPFPPGAICIGPNSRLKRYNSSPPRKDQIPLLPFTILIDHVLPFVSDRMTWNNLSMANRELQDSLCRTSMIAPPPWPTTRFRSAGRSWCVTFAPDGMSIACGTECNSRKSMVQIWDCCTGKSKLLFDPNTQQHRINTIAYSPDGKYLASGDDSGCLCLWKDSKIHMSLIGHYAGIWSVAFFTKSSPNDEQKFVSASADGTIRIWNVNTENCESVVGPSHHTRGVVSLAISKSQKIASGGLDGRIQICQPGIGQCDVLYQCGSGVARCMAFSKDSTFLAFGIGRTIRLWNCVDRSWMIFKGHQSDVRSLAVDPSGEIIASGCGQGKIRLWRVADQLCLGKWMAHHSCVVSSLSFSPNGRTLASAGSDGTIGLWSTTSCSKA